MLENKKVVKFKSGRISLKSPQGENKTGRIQNCIQYTPTNHVVELYHFDNGPMSVSCQSTGTQIKAFLLHNCMIY